MRWSDQAVRHRVASGSPDALGIERAGSQVSAFRTTTAGYQATNWRDYPSGQPDPTGWGGDVYADYEDALYPSENPRAKITGEESYGEYEYTLEVTDGSGQVVLEDTFYDLAEAKDKADKQLQKLYKGEGKLDKDQGKFFTTPGKGKLFSRRSAAEEMIERSVMKGMSDQELIAEIERQWAALEAEEGSVDLMSLRFNQTRENLKRLLSTLDKRRGYTSPSESDPEAVLQWLHSAARRTAADTSPTSQKPGIGAESDSPTVPEEHPEEDGTLKAMIARAIRTAEAEQWREVEKGLWRFEDDQFMASVTAPWPGEEAWSWTVETLARQQLRGGQAYGRLRAMSAAEDVMSAHRSAATAEGMAKRMGPGYYHEVTEYGTFGIEAAPELGGWLLYSPDYSYGDGLPASSADDSYRTKAEAMTAIREMCEDPDYYGLRRIGRRTASDEDEPKRKRQPGGQAANWGAGQLTPQRIRDEMALGQGVDFGSFGVEASFVHVGGTRIDRIVTMLDRLGLSLWTDKGPYANTVWAIDPVDQMYVPVKVTKRGSYVSARIIEPLDVGQNGAAGYDEWFRRRINRGEPTMISMDESEVVDTLDFLRAMKRTASLDSAGIMDRVVAANSEFEGAEADIRAGVPFVLVRADSDSGTGWKMTVVVEEAVQVPSGGVATDYENAKIVHMDKKDGRYSPAETAERWLRSKFNYSPDVRIVYVNGAEPVPRLSRVLHAGYQSSDWRDYPTGRRHTAAVKTAMNWWDAIDDPRHVVSGWNWDDRLAGYVSEGVADFACKCGSNVTAPGQVLCSCGKFWNSYVISSTGGMRLVCREVPVRDGVLLASRQHVADGQRVVRDPEYWGLPEGTPIEKGMKPKGKPKGDSDSDSGSESETPEAETPEAPPAPQKQKVPPLTPEELEQRITEVQAKVDEAKKAGLETDIAYAVDGKRDTYNADRRREQRRLLGVAWSRHGAKVPREGKALMSGGLGGAGKGTVLRSEGLGIDKSQYLEVNADEMKELMVEMGMVPEVEGVAPMELAALIHEESSYLSTQFAYMAYAQGTNVLWDITMGSPESVQQRIDDMREAGYEDISAVFVDIPVEKSVERALSRYERGLENYRNGKGNGGRYVPPKVIRKNAPTGDQYNSRNRETFESLKDQFDNAAVYDNSVDGRDAQKVTGFGRWARALRARYARRRR